MNKINFFFRENKTFVSLLIGCLLLLTLFVSVATISGAWPGSDASAQILSALAGAVVAAIITLFLLLGQTSSEEKKERNTKVFEEKLRIYQDFLHCLYEVIKDGKVTREEAIALEFQTSYITMHTESAHIKTIAQQVFEIVDSLNTNGTNNAEAASVNNAKLMHNLFNIVEEFKKELYQSNPNKIDVDNTHEAILAFSSIMEAVEVEQKDDVISEESISERIDQEQTVTKFTNELLQRLNINEDLWNVQIDKSLYISVNQKGNEEGVRVILSHEDNGDQYFQIHLDYIDTHEAYKHLKWRFGGRQNKWCWWKYLDASYRNVTATEDFKSGNWEKLLSVIEKQFKALIAYVETFENIRKDIFQHVPYDKANVWMYYNTCVAFDYDKTLKEERLFVDVELNENGLYNIRLGNRDNNIPLLINRLHSIGFATVEQKDLVEDRYTAYSDITANEAVARIKEIDAKIC